MLLQHVIAAMAMLAGSSASHASNCESIRAGIEAKIQSSGVTAFALSTVAADANVSGKVVGTCDLGSKKIVYTQDGGAAGGQRQRTPKEQPILTECKDGSVMLGGDCRK